MKLNSVSSLVVSFVLFLTAIAKADDQKPEMPPPVPGNPIGRCVQVLNVTTPEEAKQVGFEYLELALQNLLPLSDEDFAKQVARIRAIELPATSAYGFLPADIRVVGTNINRVQLEEVVRRSLSRASQLGVTMVVYGNSLTASRKVPEGFSRDVARRQFLEFIRRTAIEAQNKGITILIQPMPRESTDLINTVGEGLEFIEAVGNAHVKLLVDYTSFVQSKEDLAVLKRAAPHILQVEIQNPNGRIYPASADESDYASFFNALKQGGYRGGFSIHGKPGDVFVNGPRAIALLRKLAAEPVTTEEKAAK
jgi:sugar phosphate isomerase/epimerase